ncbi:MAG: thioredoxin family protein [SAR324 cluster bacterium]|nr:thioredoxin family protein [SAR324 cluster bacterium]
MVAIPSKMIPLGTTAVPFSLPDTVSGNMMSLENLKSSRATVLMFICNHCPFVKHVQTQLVQLAKDYQPRGVVFIAINSNDVANYPEDSPEKMKAVALEKGYSFPYLYDESQSVAKAYQAECTPDFFIYDSSLKCVYRGQLDNSRPGNNLPVTGRDMRQALDAMLDGNPVSSDQKPSIGCNIKWKKQ